MPHMCGLVRSRKRLFRKARRPRGQRPAAAMALRAPCNVALLPGRNSGRRYDVHRCLGTVNKVTSDIKYYSF